MSREPKMDVRIAVVLVAGALTALVAALPVASGSSGRHDASAARVASVATLTTHDFRVSVVAHRLNGGGTPTAEVRVGFARRVGGGWRELGERRIAETYFWNVVRGPRAVCRLAIATAAARPSLPPSVTVRLLLSPSLGCGKAHRLLLAPR